MGQQQSKDELLYHQVNYGNIDAVKSLCTNGASLEWVDKEGKTPLILGCTNRELYNVAKTLIQLGANVNAYRPGRHAGTPLHHAAKRGLENTVRLLLLNGANALVMNDDCQTPLDVARQKGFGNVVRAIESHICLFSGILREFHGLRLGFLDALAPKLLSKLVWVVVLPCGSRHLTKPFNLELAVYSSAQDAKPHTVISLCEAKIEDPEFNQPDPSVQIVDGAFISRGSRPRRRDRPPHSVLQTRNKFGPANAGDNQQLQWFCDACKGIPRTLSPFLNNPPHSVVQATGPPPPEAEDLELAMAISASMQSLVAETPNYNANHKASTSTSLNNSANGVNYNGVISKITVPVTNSIPTAPPISDAPIHYPSIDSSPLDLSSSVVGNIDDVTGEMKVEGASSSSCIICLDAPVEGACVPCGHMCGCMSCLEEIRAKKWECPVCRAKINQVIRLYAV